MLVMAALRKYLRVNSQRSAVTETWVPNNGAGAKTAGSCWARRTRQDREIVDDCKGVTKIIQWTAYAASDQFDDIIVAFTPLYPSCPFASYDAAENAS